LRKQGLFSFRDQPYAGFPPTHFVSHKRLVKKIPPFFIAGPTPRHLPTPKYRSSKKVFSPSRNGHFVHKFLSLGTNKIWCIGYSCSNTALHTHLPLGKSNNKHQNQYYAS